MLEGGAVYLIDKFGGYIFRQYRAALQQVEDVEQSKQEKQQIEEALREYQNRYLQDQDYVKVLQERMKKPRLLDSIYTSVEILDDVSVRDFANPDNLEQLFRQKGRPSFLSEAKRHDGLSVAKDEQYLMVLGGPGIGKSTFLRKLGLEAFKGQSGQLQSEQIPVFIELKTFSCGDLKTAIAKAFEICDLPAAEAVTDSMLKDGKLMILLDGLDEVPSQSLNQVSEHIEAFVTQYSKNTFVASCRTAYRRSFKQFRDVTIADFDDKQIEQFIRQWFSVESDEETSIADRYWEMLQRSENTATKELAQTPLLLTFLCLVYDRKQILPRLRSTLYGEALDILLKDWAAEKRLSPDPIYDDFHPELEKVLLGQIAYDSFKDDSLFFSKSKITEDIATFLSDTLDAPEQLDSVAVLTAIEQQQGILVERTTNFYSFSHLTLQEYLTASYIVKNQRVDELVREHLTDKRWREVFLLVAGLMEKRGLELLALIDTKARTYLNGQQKVCDLLRWADLVTEDSASKYKRFEQRVLALAMILPIASVSASTNVSVSVKAIAIAIARARASTSSIVIARASVSAIAIASIIPIARARARAIVNAIANSHLDLLIEPRFFNLPKLDELPSQLLVLKDKIPQPDASAEDWRSYADELESTWLNAFDITPEDISFSADEWQCFSNYLYATELLLRCKDSSIGLSRKAWEALEEKLLKLN